MLTASQSLFGVSLLLSLRFDARKTALLFARRRAFIFWSEANHAALGSVYLGLVPVALFLQRRNLRALAPLQEVWKGLKAVAVRPRRR